ncbi:nucleotidyltransferase family protein [Terribacillus saccharophilus]|uniref:nucleotidyltransferase family protein n=1 Tax=Terribacillus saccharophilus TaxID=361277 RepID=UPI0039824377
MSLNKIHAKMLKTEKDVLEAIRQDKWMMEVLGAAARLQLPDFCISAGFVRSKVWDIQHGYTRRTPLPDVDVVYFDAFDTSKVIEKKYESMLLQMIPDVPWSVKNQARMHEVNNMPAFRNTEHAIACYTETATSIGVRMNGDGLHLIAPYGVDDLLACRVAPSPLYKRGTSNHSIYLKRVKQKNWHLLWPQVRMEELQDD